jgi:peptidyl-dipeptidase Dcp
MAWHSINKDVNMTVEEFEKKAINQLDILPAVKGTNQSVGFSHNFDGGYAAGYYGYKWAEVLDADAFDVFKQHGIFDKATAQSFRDNILSKGGSEHPMELYKRFRGQEPTIDALLRRSGLKK